MTHAVATTSERVRTDKSDHCACARMRDMRLDESWTGRIWDHHSGATIIRNNTESNMAAVKKTFYIEFPIHVYRPISSDCAAVGCSVLKLYRCTK